MERVHLDTNVMFPMTLMDLMLSMAEDFHHDLLWSDYESIIETVPGPDPADRVHGAAALAGGATALLTANLRHFDAPFFAERGILVESPDSYLLRRLDHAPDHVIDTVERVVALKSQPRWTLSEYLERVDQAGAPHFASTLRARLKR